MILKTKKLIDNFEQMIKIFLTSEQDWVESGLEKQLCEINKSIEKDIASIVKKHDDYQKNVRNYRIYKECGWDIKLSAEEFGS